MSKHINRKLDILSNIADDIIESATEMRIKLLARMEKKKVNVKRIVAYSSAIAAVFILIIGSVLLMIGGDTRQIPVYTGMTASNAKSSDIIKTPVSQMFLYGEDISRLNLGAPLMISAQNNGNHYGNNNGNTGKNKQ